MDKSSHGELVTDSLESLQTEEQRRILDIVSQLRKCGLESVLSLPQLVVCGDQSAGKSSVLEALTEIPFPRNDNLCTRFATEIILRRSAKDALTIRIIPDANRPPHEQNFIKQFHETITDFDELPGVIDRAMGLMGLDKSTDAERPRRAFARDVLSVEIDGPNRPQLTLVDLPGIIQAETKDATKADVELVSEITETYIRQPRTICLAVVSATNDYANQPILTKVRNFDPKGDRTLGIITKPDRLPPGSGAELAFLQLAQNEDIFFKLGWHVLKNRSYEEANFSFLERNESEASYFRKSTFNSLPAESMGIYSLVARLSKLLFTHVQKELPKLQEETERALSDEKQRLAAMGSARVSAQDCKDYLSQLSLNYYETCKAAIGGHYEDDYFKFQGNEIGSTDDSAFSRRLRAIVQVMNLDFSEQFRINGHKFQVKLEDSDKQPKIEPGDVTEDESIVSSEGRSDKFSINDASISEPDNPFSDISGPQKLSHQKALDWVEKVIVRARGKELPGNFNPLVIGELFWEQSSKWKLFATAHVDQVSEACRVFLHDLLKNQCARDVYPRLWPYIRESLKQRHENALAELEKIINEVKSYPINYNHYYTDTIKKRQESRRKGGLKECLKAATQHRVLEDCRSNHTSASIDVDQALALYSERIDPDMEKYSCEQVLDCLFAIYKVSFDKMIVYGG